MGFFIILLTLFLQRKEDFWDIIDLYFLMNIFSYISVLLYINLLFKLKCWFLWNKCEVSLRNENKTLQ